jgi:hypothetical protein
VGKVQDKAVDNEEEEDLEETEEGEMELLPEDGDKERDGGAVSRKWW